MTNTEKQTSYDKVPYGSHPFAQTHPDRLATIGRLFGMSPAPVAQCRVLEMGCASGGNLIPMACHLPNSEFVGVDLSARQVEEGQKTIQELNLKNIRIEHASILDIDEACGSFDYVLSHGVYSWVPREVQDKMLAVASENLSPQGIAYVSYNTYPGWHMREMLRHMMLYHVRQFKDTQQQIDQAKALIDFLSTHVPGNNAYGMMLKSEIDIIKRTADWYLFHDHLEEINDPVYFHQFSERASASGLQYLGESDFGTMLTSRFPKEVAETLGKINKNIISTEQYMDFLRNRQFRQTLLCHKEVALKRNLGPADITSLLITSPAKLDTNTESGANSTDVSPAATQTFRTPKGQTISTNRPLTKAGMGVLMESWPRALAFDTLFNAVKRRLNDNLPSEEERARQMLATDLLQAYTVNVVEFHTWQGDFDTEVSEQPKVSPLAAYQCKQGKTSVVNLRHEQVPIDPLCQHLVPVLDGTRDIAALFSHLGELIRNGKLAANRENQPITDPELIRESLEQDITRRLVYLAKTALLVS